MSLEIWTIFSLAYLLVTLSPGPNVLLVLSHAVRFGYRSIFITMAANLLCQLLIVLSIAMGVGALLTVDSIAFKVIKYCGAGYLVFLGFKMIYSAIADGDRKSPAKQENLHTKPSVLIRFRQAFLVSAGNPKTVIFLAAFLPQFVDPSRSLSIQFIQMFFTIALIVISIHAIYAWVAVFVKGRIVSSTARRGTSVATGGLFIFLGFKLSTN